MAKSVARPDHRAAHRWGVIQMFGLPGDGINGFLGAAHPSRISPAFLPGSHEEAADLPPAAMQLYWSPSCCAWRLRPGASTCCNGLYVPNSTASLSSPYGPYLHDLIGTHHPARMLILTSYSSSVAAYTTRIMGPSHAANAVD